MSTGSAFRQVTWSGIDGAILKPASAPVAGLHGSISATLNELRLLLPMPPFGHSRKQLLGFSTKTKRGNRKMKALHDLHIKIFADGADIAGILDMYRNPIIRGFTTNPTLMRKARVRDYEEFAREVLTSIPDRPISLEVLADDFVEMEEQAHIIASWADNVFVKIPITNTEGASSVELIHRLSYDGIKVNVTALFTLDQVRDAVAALAGGAQANISVFAGRIADTGCDPVPIMASAVDIMREFKNLELIWASPRELLNIFQADDIGCHIITATNDILKKAALVGKDLSEYSLETVKMFCADALASAYDVSTPSSKRAVGVDSLAETVG
jgi:transaldolase